MADNLVESITISFLEIEAQAQDMIASVLYEYYYDTNALIDSIKSCTFDELKTFYETQFT